VSASQYEVFENPVPRARRAFPFVSVLQSDLADTGSDRIVAPLVPRARMAAAVGRLLPIVKVLGIEHVLVVPRLVPVAAADLQAAKDNLTGYRNEIVAALDLLFLGV
jgi:toxin CcdB